MGFGNIDLAQVLIQYMCLLFSLCVHEAAHAAMANHCGDPTARLLGRLTLDPRKHADLFGTVIFPLLGMTSGLPMLGWAKPVPVNPRNLGNIRRDQVLVAMAGPGSNILIALATVFILRILILVNGGPEALGSIDWLVKPLLLLVMMNLGLAVFNMLPVPPLDGHYLVRYFVSYRAAQMMDQIGPFGIIIAFMLARPWMSVAFPPVLNAFQALLVAGT